MGEGISHQLEAYVGQIKGFGRAGKVNGSVHVLEYEDLSYKVCRINCRWSLASGPVGEFLSNQVEVEKLALYIEKAQSQKRGPKVGPSRKQATNVCA